MIAQNVSEQRISFGLLASLLLHAGMFLCFFCAQGDNSFRPPMIYSVSIEGGKNLGGIAQVPKKDDSQLAPPKQVAGEVPSTPKEEVKEEQKSVEKKVIEETKPEEKKVVPEEKPVEKDDAEVILAEKLREKKLEEEKKALEKKAEEKKAEEKKLAEEKILKDKQELEEKKLAQEKKAKELKAAEEKKKKAENSAEEIDKKLQQAMQKYLGESSDAGAKGFGAAKLDGKAGANAMGGGVVRPPEYFIYVKRLQAHVKDTWRWIDPTAALVAQVEFEISREGEISNIRLLKSSGNREYDDSAKRAVGKANPAPMPPSSIFGFLNPITMTFDPRD